jgi:hypothetical protein
MPTGTYPVREGVENCKHYMEYGRCKFLDFCRFNHPPGHVPPSDHEEKMRTLPDGMAMIGGLPVRDGAQDCPFFMRAHMCKYGKDCKFNHPQHMQSGTQDEYKKMPVSNLTPEEKAALEARRLASAQAVHAAAHAAVHAQPAPLPGAVPPAPVLQAGMVVPPWEVHANADGVLYFFNQATQQSTWHTPPELLYPPPVPYPYMPSVYPPYPYYPYHVPVNSGIKPGMPDCTYWIKQGRCKYGDLCKFNHPPDGQASGSSYIGLGNYPERDGVPNCTFYMKTGECKYGPECKYNHPKDEERRRILESGEDLNLPLSRAELQAREQQARPPHQPRAAALLRRRARGRAPRRAPRPPQLALTRRAARRGAQVAQDFKNSADHPNEAPAANPAHPGEAFAAHPAYQGAQAPA